MLCRLYYSLQQNFEIPEENQFDIYGMNTFINDNDG
jgi:hypothetical protein